ncbi:ARS binding protein 2 [Penicillium atrosanguineum]|uniref:ARS binding protein 2 n=1 Tax=Penicillium atrosanguineum TaxID=1132637 RepID=A0A9W9PT02_9EURO|nr:ARS binding protein 2 [Penicillium atrosanguineum]
MESSDHSSRNDVGPPQMVIQQYARYPSTLESALQSASSLGSARSQAELNKSPPLHRKGTPRSLQSSPRGIRSAIPSTLAARCGPSMSPPLFEVMRQHQMKDPTDQAESRVLPSRDVTDETIDDTYVMFILYCNPNVPSSVDTSELRKTFRCPPRSDGKSFSVFRLFELIRRLDNKELKTWIQLAIELGVEPPSMEKKQSTQKVQQYAVRLKRWMRAMHVDAFFEYCLGHPHAYYTQLPPSGPFVSESRDGVPLEEDLALRALVPQWKPKRGRKRAEEKELEEEKVTKRPQLDTSVAALHQGSFQDHSVTFPQSAIPFSAYPDTDGHDPWMTASSAFPQAGASDQHGQELRWRLPERDTSPADYPQSAIIPRGNQPADVIMSAEPMSAVTPSLSERNRIRRRHGPAVSSAWPSNNGSSTGKSRGRPPSKPSVSGSFSTFQVNPSRESSQIPQGSNVLSSPFPVDHNSSTSIPTSYNHSPTPANNGRPGKLQLQVPQHLGAPVRLATPPTLLVNGVNGADIPQAEGPQDPQPGDNGVPVESQGLERSDSIIPTNEIIRALSYELPQARITGRAVPLNPEEAHGLASEMVASFLTMHSHLPGGLSFPLLAFYLGVGHHFDNPAPNPVMIVINAHSNSTTTHAGSGTQGSNNGTKFTVSLEYSQSCHLSMQIAIGTQNRPTAISGSFSGTMITTHPPEATGDNLTAEFDFEEEDLKHTVSETTWRQRYLKLRAQMQKKDRALSQYKRNIVESVMADI